MSKVAILLAVHNGALYLDAAIESVCKQTFTDWELLAVENGSTDNTLAILEEWALKDPRIKVFVNASKGKNEAFNRAFQESSAEYVCYFAADDVLHISSIENRLKPLLHDSSLAYTTCLLETISTDEKFNGIIFPKKQDSPNFSGGSIFFRRDIANKVFPIPPGLPNEDVWTALHLKHFGNGKHLAESLYFYRIHQANSYGYHVNFDAKRKGFLTRMAAFDLFLEKYRQELPFAQKKYLEDFTKGREHAENRRIVRILMSSLPIKDRILFVYYCSPFLFWLKQRLFKLLSGKLELV